MKLIFLILAVLAALLVLAVKYLPWWASLLLLAAGILGVKWGMKHLFRRLLTIPFKMKGKVLAGAALRIHGIESAPMPTPKTYDDEEVDPETQQRYQQLKWYYLDVSIRPAEKTDGCNGFTAWEPGELMLVPATAKANDLENDLDHDVCEIHDIKIHRDGQFGADEDGKYVGAQRLQFYIGVQPEIKQLKFRYYFELFGLISIPAYKLPSAQAKPIATAKTSLPTSSQQTSPLDRAKQGDVEAIAALINRSLQAKGTTARVVLKDGCLKVMLESAAIPDPEILAPYIFKGVTGLGIASLQLLQVYGRRTGEKAPAWSKKFALKQAVPQTSVPQPEPSLATMQPIVETVIADPDNSRMESTPSAPINDLTALETHLNRVINDDAITILVEREATLLKVTAKTDKFLDGQSFAQTIHQELGNADLTGVETVSVYKQKIKGSYGFQIKSFSLTSVKNQEPEPEQPVQTTMPASGGGGEKVSAVNSAIGKQSSPARSKPKIKIGRLITVGIAGTIGFFVIVRTVNRMLSVVTLSPVFGGFSVILGLFVLWRAWVILNPLLQTLLKEE